MATYPISAATKTNLDSSSDSPAAARAELATAIDLLNEVIVGYDQGINVDRYGGLAAAVASSETAGKTLHVTTAQTVSTSLTISNRSVVVHMGGTLSIASGQTLTVSGPFTAPSCQVFTGSGTVTFTTGQQAIPEWWGAVGNGTTDDAVPCQASLTASKYVTFDKAYGTTVPLAPQTGSTVVVNGSIKALAATWTGEGVIQYDGVTGVSLMQDCIIEGGGSIDANSVADIGVYVKLGRRVNVKIAKIEKATVNGILMGQTGAAATSYECHVYGTVVNNASGTDNGATSVGILYNNCTDSKVVTAVVVGYRKGFATTSSSPDVSFIACHAWTINTYGPMTYGFDLSGRAYCYNCYADTPTNVGNSGPDAGITDVYGFYINADGSMLYSSRVNLNVTYSTDNIATAFFINRASGFFGTIAGARMSASATAKFKNIVGWAGTGNMVGATILGIETDGNTYAYGYVTNEMRQALGVHGTLTVYNGASATTSIDANGRIHGSLPGYATNAAAISGGLVAGDWYRDTDDSSIKVVY